MTNVGGMANSSGSGGKSGGLGSGSGGGEGSGPPTGGVGEVGGGVGPPRNPAQNNQFTMVYAVPLISCGLNDWLQPWTGGYLDQEIMTTMQDLAQRITLCTRYPCCALSTHYG